MKENSSIIAGEHSFFADRSFNCLEKGKSQKDLTKNSSNPEKIYEILNSEIKKVTDTARQRDKVVELSSDLNNSNKTNDFLCNEQLLDPGIWNESKASPHQQDSTQYYKKYEYLKKTNKVNQKSKKKQIQKINNPAYEQHQHQHQHQYSADIEEEIDEKTNVNKISSIDIKANTFTKEAIQLSNNRLICVTEPDENSYNAHRPYFSESLSLRPIQSQSNNTPQQYKTNNDANPYFLITQQRNLFNQFQSMQYNTNTNNSINNYNTQVNFNKGSFSSTNYSNNKMQNSNDFEVDYDDNDFNENFDGIKLGTNAHYNTYQYRARIPTNESTESNKSSKYNHHPNININPLQWSDPNDRKIYSFSFNESNYYPPSYYPRAKHGMNSNTNMNMNGNGNGNGGISNAKNEKQIINLDDILSGKDTRTTVMIRNIPIKYTDEMLIQELKQFDKKYDCIYMPYDFEKGGNKGYAFINFTHAFHIILFYELFEGKSWAFFESKKICELNNANFQGIDEIKKHAKNYKGVKKPSFFDENGGSDANGVNANANAMIEIPDKYLSKLLLKYPQLKYTEKKQTKTVVIKAWT